MKICSFPVLLSVCDSSVALMWTVPLNSSLKQSFFFSPHLATTSICCHCEWEGAFWSHKLLGFFLFFVNWCRIFPTFLTLLAAQEWRTHEWDVQEWWCLLLLWLIFVVWLALELTLRKLKGRKSCQSPWTYFFMLTQLNTLVYVH